MSMQVKEPSEGQKKAIEQRGKVVLRACPGSGKTFTVAHKLAKRLKIWKHRHYGIAAITFTNVACDEIKEQLEKINMGNAIGYPHYLGTIDSFINKYIFLPFGHLVMKCQERPNIVGFEHNVWNPSGFKWLWRNPECYNNQCKLIDFSYSIDGNVIRIKDDDKINCPYNRTRCTELKKQFTIEGYANQSDANYFAMRILEEYPEIAKILSRRFPEFIIDEAQDTSETQMKIMDLLVDKGLSEIMLIGDQDQAIYEWRDARPQIFINKISSWETVTLNENLRSSQLICEATKGFSSLPNISKATGETAKLDISPRIVKYRDDKLGILKEYFINECRKYSIEIAPEKVAILIRGHALLNRMMGIEKDIYPWKDSNIVTKQLAQAVYYRDCNPPDLKNARKYLESTCSIICFGNNSYKKAELIQKVEEKIGIRNWQIGLWKLLKSLPKSDIKLEEWLNKTKQIFNSKWFRNQDWPINNEDNFDIEVKRGGRYRENYEWALDQPVGSFLKKTSVIDNIYMDTIHSAKGKTYEAILAVIPKHHAAKGNIKELATVSDGHEEIRTVYVAMTRPRKLLIIAVPDNTEKEDLHRFPDWMKNNIITLGN